MGHDQVLVRADERRRPCRPKAPIQIYTTPAHCPLRFSSFALTSVNQQSLNTKTRSSAVLYNPDALYI